MSLLLSQIQIADFSLKNRIVMPPMDMYAANDGFVNPFHLHHYAARALGGVGLIIVEASAINKDAKIDDRDLGIYKDEHITGLRELADSVHYFESKIAIQLNHAGRKNGMKEAKPIAPSPIAFNESYGMPKELSKDEIKLLTKEFIAAAIRAKEAGFDAVEIHAAHGYLLSSFLSPLSNKRDDEYGGSLENRARFLCEVIEGIKNEVKLPVFVRFSATEWEAGGFDINEAKKLGVILEQAGVAMLDISAGGNISKPSLAPKPTPLYQASYAKAIKEVVNIPVSCVGLIASPSEAEALLLGGVCDLVAFGRELLRNPNLANLAAKEFKQMDKITPSYVRGYM